MSVQGKNVSPPQRRDRGSNSLSARPPFSVDTAISKSLRPKLDPFGLRSASASTVPGIKPLPPPTPATAHRRYTPVYKCSNRLLAKRWDDTAARRHREKIASMKPAIDNKPPQRCSHLEMGLKKLRQEQEKSHRIQEENIILLNRMARQLQAPQGFSNIDANYHVKETHRKLPSNNRVKQKQAQELEQANQAMVERIAEQPPVYSREAWSEARRQNLVYFANHTRFPETYQEIFEREGVRLPYGQAQHLTPQTSKPVAARLTRESDAGEESDTGDEAEEDAGGTDVNDDIHPRADTGDEVDKDASQIDDDDDIQPRAKEAWASHEPRALIVEKTHIFKPPKPVSKRPRSAGPQQREEGKALRSGRHSAERVSSPPARVMSQRGTSSKAVRMAVTFS
ncbi:hypothetical protein PhCBS80983_g00339 [Powellomyces hirtus]|uniref:Uncharacterized protein n=1 Tax=Powellomyces hirtus TaxID=109895 RepID=A0A507EH82_9FUNG|nr:hypothetical protein PhCBS80983_g00339 [Powellomyces hirtus]